MRAPWPPAESRAFPLRDRLASRGPPGYNSVVIPGRRLVWAAALLLAGTGCVIDRGGLLFLTDEWSSDPGQEESEAAVEIEDEAVPEPDDEGAPDPIEADPGETCATLGPGFCEDGLACTENTCRDSAEGPVCDRVIAAGTCLIGGTCLAAGQEESGNSCRLCDPAASNVDWTPRPDLTACAGGICCSGLCRPGGQCCADWDCDGCVGVPDSCSSMPSETDCSRQGCDWVPEGTCTGGYGCSTWDWEYDDCTGCGCGWQGDHDCRGEVPCPDYATLAECETMSDCGCNWVTAGGRCSGTPESCSAATLPSECSESEGCQWLSTATCNTSTFVCQS